MCEGFFNKNKLQLVTLRKLQNTVGGQHVKFLQVDICRFKTDRRNQNTIFKTFYNKNSGGPGILLLLIIITYQKNLHLIKITPF